MKLDRRIKLLFGEGSRGTLTCHIFGKSGEVFYASGFLPELRRQAPGWRIVYKVLETYAPILAQTTHRPDEVLTYPRRHVFSLVEDVNGLILGMQNDLEFCGGYWFSAKTVNNLELSMYFDNLSRADDDPFFIQNFHSLGCWENYARPGWESRWRAGERPVCLVLPSGNTQSAIGTLPLTPDDWAGVARDIVARGGRPAACFHPEDPRVEMPGWEVFAEEGPHHVLDYVSASTHVVGINSGMTFAALCASPGKVTMLNQHPYAYYDFGPMGPYGVYDVTRHQQWPITIDISRDEALALVRRGFEVTT